MDLFEARTIHYDGSRDDGVLVAVATSEPDGRGFRLEFQRDTEPTAQDRELGQDCHCLVTGEGAAFYGAISESQFEVDGVTLHLVPGAAEELSIPSRFRLCVAGSDPSAAPFLAGLHRILKTPTGSGTAD